jgi:hypothetical protein
MYGSGSSQRINPLGWVLTLGLVSLAALGVCRLFGVEDLLGAFRTIVLAQAFVIALGTLFLIVIDTVAGPDREQEEAARRQLWFGRNEADAAAWDDAIQSHLKVIAGELADARIPTASVTWTEASQGSPLRVVEAGEPSRSHDAPTVAGTRRAPAQLRRRVA